MEAECTSGIVAVLDHSTEDRVSMGIALIVHGGAGAMSRDRFDDAREGCREAALAGWQILLQGGSALDAVQTAIVVLENNPSFNAGTGAVLTQDGRAELDAGLMDGNSLDVGAIAGVQRVKNPIVLARSVLCSPHALLMGAGAEEFATHVGMTLADPSELITPAQRARWQRGYSAGDDVNIAARPGGTGTHRGKQTRAGSHAGLVHADGHKHGTVGAVAIDSQGRTAAGASTGGIAAKHPGRIGDTPLPGCGFYAEDGLGGVASTGHGEDFIRLLLARRALDFIAAGHSAQASATAAIRLLDSRVHGSGGLILLDGEGRVGYARNTPTMAHAFIREGMPSVQAGV
jgi:beta-aspartyl-peptidase (threonine type)